MKKRMFTIDIETGFIPKEGTEFDAVREAFEFAAVPAALTQNAEGRILVETTAYHCCPGGCFTVICDALELSDIPAEVTEV